MKQTEIQNGSALLPDNKMQLMDGSVIDIYPRQDMLERIDNTLQLDTTGEYLSMKKGEIRPSASIAHDVADERKFFLDNVFFFVAHCEEVLSDSRMFLAPVPVQNGLAYSGTNGFKHPTLGVYLEWWMHHGHTIVADDDGKLKFYWFISGSPLSGRNACSVVDEYGVHEQRPVSGFPNYWRTFKNVNTRYDECKGVSAAYTLQQVKDLLSRHGNGNYLDKAYIYGYRWMKK